MSKQYGLISKKKSDNVPCQSSFAADRVKRESKIDKALEEDPNIFAYDEIYDDMKKEQNAAVQQSNEGGETRKVERKSKFIQNLKNKAEERKIAEERRLDKKIQKEREAEGDIFKDKEVFVTDAYRQKLMESKIHQQREKQELELEGGFEEKMMDVTKQKEHGMTAFFSNFLSQTVGEKVDLNPKEKYLDKMAQDLRKQLFNKDEDKQEEERAEFKKSSKNVQSKRQRKSESSSEEEEVVIQSLRKGKERKRHEKSSRQPRREEIERNDENKSKNDKEESQKEKKDLDELKDEKEPSKVDDKELSDDKKELNRIADEKKEEVIEPQPVRLSLREILTDLFRKRCVDQEFEAAQKRYFKRRANY